MNILHENVEHTLFGTGKIIAQSDSTVTVCFSSRSDEKKFLYPQAFDRYLTLLNPERLPELEAELSVLRARSMEEHKKIEAARQAELLAWKKVNSGEKPKRPSRTRIKK
jgi:hypothetical protein